MQLAVLYLGQNSGYMRLLVLFAIVLFASCSTTKNIEDLTENDVIMDLGCGDGRIVLNAVARCVEAITKHHRISLISPGNAPS